MKSHAVFIEIETLKFRNLISCKPSNVSIIHLKSCVLRLENLYTPWYNHMQNCDLFWTHGVVNQVVMSFTGNNRVWFPLTKNWQVRDYIPLGCLGHAKNGYSYRHSLRLLWPCDSLLKLLFTTWLWQKSGNSVPFWGYMHRAWAHFLMTKCSCKSIPCLL